MSILGRLFRRLAAAILLVAFPIILQGCAVYSVADTAVSVVATGVKTTAKVVGGAAELAVDAVTPSDDREKRLEALERICDRNPDYHECRALDDY